MLTPDDICENIGLPFLLAEELTPLNANPNTRVVKEESESYHADVSLPYLLAKRGVGIEQGAQEVSVDLMASLIFVIADALSLKEAKIASLSLDEQRVHSRVRAATESELEQTHVVPEQAVFISRTLEITVDVKHSHIMGSYYHPSHKRMRLHLIPLAKLKSLIPQTTDQAAQIILRQYARYRCAIC